VRMARRQGSWFNIHWCDDPPERDGPRGGGGGVVFLSSCFWVCLFFGGVGGGGRRKFFPSFNADIARPIVMQHALHRGGSTWRLRLAA